MLCCLYSIHRFLGKEPTVKTQRSKPLSYGQMLQQPPGWYGLTTFGKAKYTGPDGKPYRRARLWCQDFDPAALTNGKRRVTLRRVERTGPTDHDANESIEQFKVELRKRFPAGEAVAQQRACTVAEAVNAYLELKVRGVLEPRSIAVYECTARAVIAKLGELSLDHLKPQLIRDALWEAGRKRSKERIELLGRAIASAIDSGTWTGTHNPVAAVPAVYGKKITRAHTITRGPIAPADIAALLASISADPQWLAFYFIAAFAGPRCSELLNARRADYDPEQGTLFIRSSKTGAGVRFIVLGHTGRALIERLIKAHVAAGCKGDFWLFPAQCGKAFSHSSFSKCGFKPQMLAAGLAEKIGRGPAVNNPDRQRKHKGIAPKFTMHEFRHTVSTRDRDVMPPMYLDAQLGHANATRLADPNAAKLNYAHAQDPSLFPKRRDTPRS